MAHKAKVQVFESNDNRYIGHFIIELHEGDEYVFFDGREFKVVSVIDNTDSIIYYSNDYWVRVRKL